MATLGFTDGSVVKNLPANARGMGLIPGSGRSPGEGNGNILAWESPWTEEPGRLQSVGLQSVSHDLALNNNKLFYISLPQFPLL